MNTEEKKELGSRSIATVLYVGMFGIGFWRAFRLRRGAPERHPREGSVASSLEKAVRHGEQFVASAEHTMMHAFDAVSKKKPGTGHDKTQQGPMPLQDLQAAQGNQPLDRLAQTAGRDVRKDCLPQNLPQAGFEESEQSWSHDSDVVTRVLLYQRLEEPRLKGWVEPRPAKLPVPTFAPAIMAFAIVLFAMGLATTWYVCLAGAIAFAVAAWRWVDELQEAES